MKYSRSTEKVTISVLYILLIFIFGFMYFIVYRTQSRINWYNEMNNQSENMIKEFKEATGIR